MYFGSAQTRIRKVISGGETRYFYQIESQGKYGTNTASIDYLDLLEVIKAIRSINTEIEKDIASNQDYLENKFTTIDGFLVGDFVNKGKVSWFLKLERNGSDNTLFLKEDNNIEQVFIKAKNKIEEYRK